MYMDGGGLGGGRFARLTCLGFWSASIDMAAAVGRVGSGRSPLVRRGSAVRARSKWGEAGDERRRETTRCSPHAAKPPQLLPLLPPPPTAPHQPHRPLPSSPPLPAALVGLLSSLGLLGSRSWPPPRAASAARPPLPPRPSSRPPRSPAGTSSAPPARTRSCRRRCPSPARRARARR